MFSYHILSSNILKFAYNRYSLEYKVPSVDNILYYSVMSLLVGTKQDKKTTLAGCCGIPQSTCSLSIMMTSSCSTMYFFLCNAICWSIDKLYSITRTQRFPTTQNIINKLHAWYRWKLISNRMITSALRFPEWIIN